MSETIDSHSAPPTLRWIGGVDGHLALIDQTRLPRELVELDCYTVEQVWEAIRRLSVRGAPAIGVAAAYGVCLGLSDLGDDPVFARRRLDQVVEYLATSRPTAVNLFWALDRMQRVFLAALAAGSVNLPLREVMLLEALAIEAEDRDTCGRMGEHGAALLQDGDGVLTHCNAGSLATAGDGTALAVIYAAHAQGKRLAVYADETRPLLQGARLTAWELQRRGIDVTLITDSMAAQVMREGRIAAVIVGADRIAASGDAANKIGTYSAALCAAAHEIPFYVVAPASTFDLSLADGTQIPIEQRDPREVTSLGGIETAPPGIKVYNPAFDVTPARLIRGIVCEHGVIAPVCRESIAGLLRPPMRGCPETHLSHWERSAEGRVRAE